MVCRGFPAFRNHSNEFPCAAFAGGSDRKRPRDDRQACCSGLRQPDSAAAIDDPLILKRMHPARPSPADALGGELLIAGLLRRGGVPVRSAIRPLVADALTQGSARSNTRPCCRRPGVDAPHHYTPRSQAGGGGRTVQENAVAHLTDARLTPSRDREAGYGKMRGGVVLRQSHPRLAKRGVIMVGLIAMPTKSSTPAANSDSCAHAWSASSATAAAA